MLGMVLGIINFSNEKRVYDFSQTLNSVNGGSDETRTRDLRRDRLIKVSIISAVYNDFKTLD